MPPDSAASSTSLDALSKNLLDALRTLAGPHPGFRPVHAKGLFCSGTFTPAATAAAFTSAPHAARPLTPVFVRFSDSGGAPDVPDDDPMGGSPRGMAIRFQLAEHVHTDIVAHSHNGFPTRTGEEFLEMLRSVPLSGPDVPKPTPVERFLATHPAAMKFVTAPKPIATSFAREAYFAVTAFRFTNQAGQSRFGRFKIRPEAGVEHSSAEEAARKLPNFLSDELTERLARGPAKFRIAVQIAAAGDEVADATNVWPDDREELEFGTVALAKRENELDSELRKIIFDPVPRVDGIDPSDDPLIQVRSMIYLLSGRQRRAAGA